MILRSERLRHALGLLGVALFLSYPVAQIVGSRARWERRCAGRGFTGTFDDCFNDGLPVEPVLGLLTVLIFAWPFARLAFSFFAPDPDARTRRWRLARRGPRTDYVPLLQAFAAIGLLWVLWNGWGLPLWWRYWPLWVYWACFSAWLVAGLLASLPDRDDT